MKSYVLIFLLLIFFRFSFGQPLWKCPDCGNDGIRTGGVETIYCSNCQARGCAMCKWTGIISQQFIRSKCKTCNGTSLVSKSYIEKSLRPLPTNCIIKDLKGNIVKGKSKLYYITTKDPDKFISSPPQIGDENKNCLGTLDLEEGRRVNGERNLYAKQFYKGKILENLMAYMLSIYDDKPGGWYIVNRNDQSKLIIETHDEECICVAYGIMSENLHPSGNSNPSDFQTIEYQDGRYEGQVLNGKPHGKGIYKKNNELVYEGEFKNGLFDGFGKVKLQSGEIMEGEFKNGKMDGFIKIKYNNGESFEGEFKNGERRGAGRYFDKDGKLIKNEFTL